MKCIYKYVILHILLIIWQASPQAQQLPLFTQHQAFQSVINPAALSSHFLLHETQGTINLSSRIQWTTLEGAPKTNLLQGDYILMNQQTSLLAGGYILQDKIGPTSTTGIYARLAGILSDGDPYFGGIVLGLSAGFAQYQLNATDIEVTAANDPLLAVNQQQLYPDIGVGIFMYKQLDGGGFLDGDKVYFGLSVPQILGLDLTFKDLEGNYALERIPHYFAQIGLYKFINENNVWHSSTWFQYAAGVPLQIAFNTRFEWNHNFWLGAGLSNNKILHLETGVLVGNYLDWGKGVRIGYGYDHAFTAFGAFTGATHEVSMSIGF